MVKMSTERMILKVWFMNQSKKWKPMIVQNTTPKELSVTTWNLCLLQEWMKMFLNNFLKMSRIHKKTKLKNKLKKFSIQIIPKLHSHKVLIFSNVVSMSVSLCKKSNTVFIWNLTTEILLSWPESISDKIILDSWMLSSKDTDGITIFLNLTIQSSFPVDGEDISLWLSLPLKIKMTEWDFWSILQNMTSVKLYFMETLSNKIQVSYSHKQSEMISKSLELLELPLCLK